MAETRIIRGDLRVAVQILAIIALRGRCVVVGGAGLVIYCKVTKQFAPSATRDQAVSPPELSLLVLVFLYACFLKSLLEQDTINSVSVNNWISLFPHFPLRRGGGEGINQQT